MGRLLNATASGALALALALAGCGGSSSSSTSQPSATGASGGQTTSAGAGTQTSGSAPGGASGGGQASTASAPKQHLPKVTIQMSSPAFNEGGQIPAQYTCDGADVSPPMRWSAIPHGNAELALFILNLNSTGAEPVVYWAVAGLRPTLRGLSAGRLPAGAIVGRNSLGKSRYTICPAKGEGSQDYAVVLLALPHRVATTPGFNGPAVYTTLANIAEYKGLMGFNYQRR